MIMFDTPGDEDQAGSSAHGMRKGRFILGNYNKKLVNRILLHNGLTPTTGDDFCLMWGSSPESDSIKFKSPFQKINHFPMSNVRYVSSLILNVYSAAYPLFEFNS